MTFTLPHLARNSRARELACAGIWLATLSALIALLHPHRDDLDSGTIALILLLPILAGTLGSLRLALAASILSALAYNYFFTTPYDSLEINSSTSVAAFAVYLIIAIAMAVLSDRLRRYAVRSDERADHATLLRDLTIDLVSQRAWLQPPVSSALAELVRSLHLHGAAIKVDVPGGESFFVHSGHADAARASATTLVTELHATQHPDELTVTTLRSDRLCSFPVATTSAVYGVLSIEPSPDTDIGPTDERVASLFANVVALACERAVYIKHAVESRTLEETDRLRVQMMRAVTHDLRTPLTSIRALASTLDTLGPLTADQRDSIADIEAQSSRLTLLVAHVLDLSRIESGSLRLRLTNVTVEEVVRTAAAAVRSQADFLVEIPDDLPLVPVDETLLQQALINLLENAVRHGTSPFELRVQVRSNRLEISVSDHGKGIPESERRRIFDPNYAMRHETPDQRSRGLGLAVTSGFVAAHGGQTRVEPTPGGGATFVISLPIGQSA